jgi:hypothetical protein
MEENQSRYGIVERLVARKLDMMTEKSDLKGGLKLQERHIYELKQDLASWQKDVQVDIKREQRERKLEIERAIQEFNNDKEQIRDEEKAFDDQIRAVEEALQSIEEISRASSDA